MADKIVQLLPAHRVYVEPFAGAANVLFAKPKSEMEVLNDLDWRITTLLRVLKEPAMYEELVHSLRYTLYSRNEF
ncbi:MAG: DNA adenine methylase, partial [Nitrososphaerota archaeon]